MSQAIIMSQSSRSSSRSNQDQRRQAADQQAVMADMLAKRFGGISMYLVLMVALATAIVATGVVTTQQIQQYRQDYKTLLDMRRQYHQLQVEHQRLLIEQQTFSATPQIAARAVAELGMYAPSLQDKMILQPTATTPSVSSTTKPALAAENETASGDETVLESEHE